MKYLKYNLGWYEDSPIFRVYELDRGRKNPLYNSYFLYDGIKDDRDDNPLPWKIFL